MTRTQTERVILAAKSFRGVCAVEFMAPDVIDNGPPITRLAARIFDAERQGHIFEVIGWRNKTKVYRWVEGPEVERTVSADSNPAYRPSFGPGEQRPVTQSTSAEGSHKAPGGQDDAGLITRASTDGSLSPEVKAPVADPDVLFQVETGSPHWREEAA
jgi:hypothetical protein